MTKLRGAAVSGALPWMLAVASVACVSVACSGGDDGDGGLADGGPRDGAADDAAVADASEGLIDVGVDAAAPDDGVDAGSLDDAGIDASFADDTGPDAFVVPDADLDAYVAPDTGCTENATRCSAAGAVETCQSGVFVQTNTCLYGCLAESTTSARCGDISPSNVAATLLDGNTVDVTVSSSAVWNTSTCAEPQMSRVSGVVAGTEYCVLRARDFVVASGATLRIEGAYPLVVLASRQATVAGTIDLDAYAGSTTLADARVLRRSLPGAGGFIGGGPNRSPQPNEASPGVDGSSGTRGRDGGGSSGGFAGSGVSGGDGRDEMTGVVPGGNGPPAVDAMFLQPLRGGSGGGRGGGAGGGFGGAGGGALQITTPQRIIVSGSIVANGGGANGGYPGTIGGETGGGGGGGTGGSVLLETIELTLSGSIAVTGGAGGGGGCGTVAGGDGSDGPATGRALGGSAGTCEGVGGGGAGDRSARGERGVDAVNGGGGGGAAGFVVFRTPPTSNPIFNRPSINPQPSPTDPVLLRAPLRLR